MSETAAEMAEATKEPVQSEEDAQKSGALAGGEDMTPPRDQDQEAATGDNSAFTGEVTDRQESTVKKEEELFVREIEGTEPGDAALSFLDYTMYIGEWRAKNEGPQQRLIYRHGKGKFEYPDGSSYDGEWDTDRPHGEGVAEWEDGSRFEGRWDRGEMAAGKLTTAKGDIYYGSFQNGVKHGNGEIQYANGTSYKGELNEGKKHGVGTYIYSNMDKYVGEWADDLPHGQGVYQADKGWLYEGQFEAGKRHGQGKMSYVRGEQYVGEWIHGSRHGAGRISYLDGSYYDGEWVMPITRILVLAARVTWQLLCLSRFTIGDMVQACSSLGVAIPNFSPENYLTVKYGGTDDSTIGGEHVSSDAAEGDDSQFFFVYEGEWNRGLKHGLGKLTYPTGESYDGEWSNNLRHGAGIMTAETYGYDGEYRLDKRHGRGTIIMNDGFTYNGEFQEGLQHGSGKCTTSSGAEMSGTFVHGEAHGPATITHEIKPGVIFKSTCQYHHGKRVGSGRVDTHGTLWLVDYDDTGVMSNLRMRPKADPAQEQISETERLARRREEKIRLKEIQVQNLRAATKAEKQRALEEEKLSKHPAKVRFLGDVPRGKTEGEDRGAEVPSSKEVEEWLKSTDASMFASQAVNAKQ